MKSTYKFEALIPFQRIELRKRWDSIKKFAEINMRFREGGSYANVLSEKVSPALAKDEKALEKLDAILREVLAVKLPEPPECDRCRRIDNGEPLE